MTEMKLTFSDDNGVMTFNLTASDSGAGARTTLRDTDNGVEVTTSLVGKDGNERRVVDKVDRATPALQLMQAVWAEYEHAFLYNAQARFNYARYERLKAEGKPITMQTMCMCGHHTGAEYAEVPFMGGIVGVADVPQGEVVDVVDGQVGGASSSVMSAEEQEKVRKMLEWLPNDTEEAA